MTQQAGYLVGSAYIRLELILVSDKDTDYMPNQENPSVYY